MVGHSKRANEKKRERTRAKDAAAIFASSSPLFCSVCCLHRPHHLQPLTHHYVAPSPKGRAATPSASGRCHLHTSPATRRAATRAVGQPPSLVLVLASLPLFQVVRVGQRASHGGRSPPAHPVDPLHPAGVCLGILAAPREIGRGSFSHLRAARVVRAIQSFWIFCAVVLL